VSKLFGEVLRAIRECAGLSIRDLSRATGIAAGQLSQLETGVKRDPTFATARKIAGALGVSLDAFAAACEGEDTPTASADASAVLHQLRELEAITIETEHVAERLRALTRQF
jgi:transcriptional regulator with XRE-family HTH domain